jgi:glycosyltransferase involved in cell wall biosynthesis
MSVYVDVSPAVHAKAGLSRYASSLAQALHLLAPDRLACFYNKSGDSCVPEWLNGCATRSVRAGYKPWRMLVYLGQLGQIGFDRLVPDCELFHATEHLLLPLRGCPSVLTIHDLIFNLFPERHKRLNRWYLNAALPLFCRRADRIICVSERTKADLLRIWDVDAAKVDVVYEAADDRFQPVPDRVVAAVRRKYGLPDRYLLSVGTIEPRKNLDRLLDAVRSLRRQGQAVNLVLVGRLGWLYEGFLKKLDAFEYSDAVLRCGYVPDDDLPAVYAGATATVMASIYEGFGLPVLESMACGTPVVCSSTSSLPEFGGEAARYFDPSDIYEMAAAIGEVWSDPDLRKHMSVQGAAQSARFSWQTTARRTIAVYQKTGAILDFGEV